MQGAQIHPAYLQQSRPVRQLIVRSGGPIGIRPSDARRKVPRQQRTDGVHPGDRPLLEAPGAEMLLHQPAYRFPLRGADPARKAPVGNDLYGAIRELDDR